MPVSFVSSLLCTLKSFLIVQASPFSNPVSNFLNCLLSFRDRSKLPTSATYLSVHLPVSFYTGNSFAVLYCIILMTALASCTRRHFVRENELHQRQMPISNLINFPQRFGILAFEIIFILSYRKNFHSTPLLYKIHRKLSPNNNNYLAPMGSFLMPQLSLCRHQKGSGTFPENLLLPSSALSPPRRK